MKITGENAITVPILQRPKIITGFVPEYSFHDVMAIYMKGAQLVQPVIVQEKHYQYGHGFHVCFLSVVSDEDTKELDRMIEQFNINPL